MNDTGSWEPLVFDIYIITPFYFIYIYIYIYISSPFYIWYLCYLPFFILYIYFNNIRTLWVNIQCICTSFRNRQNSELFRPVSQRIQMNFIFNDNVPILCLSCNVKKVGKLVRFKQKGQKQASFLAFHKCCEGCLLHGPRYISTSFILVCALRCTWLQGTRKVYS